MNGRPVGRPQLNGLDELAAAGWRFCPDRDHGNLTGCRKVEGQRRVDHLIWRPTHTVAPAVDLPRRRRRSAVALRSTGVGPADESRNLALGQRALVSETAEPRIGGPWRHLVRAH